MYLKIQIPILLPGSIESIEFNQALQKCKQKIFNTELIKNYLECKWQQVNWVAKWLTIFSILNTLIINFHLFNPGNQKCIYLLFFVAFLFFSLQYFVYRASGWHFDYVSKLSLTLAVLTITYSIITLIRHNTQINILLPIINLLSWFQLVQNLQFNKSIRMFISLLLRSIKSLRGFLIFLGIMLLTFTTTLTIIWRNERRDSIIDMGKGDESFDVDLYLRNDLLKTWYDHYYDSADALYTILMILYGEYDYKYQGQELSPFLKIFSLCTSFVLLTILMNIIVSLMNETYGQQMSEIEESDGNEKNQLISWYEILIVYQRFAGQRSFFTWSEYKDQQTTDEQSQTCQILTNIKHVENHQKETQSQTIQILTNVKNIEDHQKEMQSQIQEIKTQFLEFKTNQNQQFEEIMNFLINNRGQLNNR